MIAAVTRADLSLYRRLLAQARPYWRHLVAILLLDLVATPLALLGPVPLKIAVDSVIGSEPLPGFIGALLRDERLESPLALLALAAGLQVAVLLVAQVRELAWYLLRARAGQGVTLAFRARLFRHAQRLSLAFHDRRGTADSEYRIQWDAPGIQWLTIDGIIPFVSAGVMFVSMVYVIVLIDFQLALVALVVGPVLFVVSRTFDRRTRHRYDSLRQLDARALAIVQEVLGALRVVKAFGREEREQERFISQSGATAAARTRLSLAEGVFGVLVNLTLGVGTVLVLVIGVRNVLAGTLTTGAFLVVLSYLSQLYRPLEAISHQVASLQDSLASVRRAFDLLDEVPDVIEQPRARSLPRAVGAVEFQDVSFTYDRDVVLRGVSLRVEAGTRVGIVGPTGAGKTTLVSLLFRFYDPTAGCVLLDGVDVRQYRLFDLRNQFAVVLQEPVLFSTTIRENIAYGRPEASSPDIMAAARAANAHDFISRLPDGYDTVLGERGMTLSGGEKQRLSIARAFLKDAPILILDEPSSALDAGTERLVVEALERLTAGRTTLIIAHRHSTIRGVDRIVVLDRGEIVETGRQADLLAAGGLYARLYRQQIDRPIDVSSSGVAAPEG
jgi:ATP-binding cassette, subfamily B, bacterial